MTGEDGFLKAASSSLVLAGREDIGAGIVMDEVMSLVRG